MRLVSRGQSGRSGWGDRGVNSYCPWLHTRSLSDGSAQGCFHKLLQACGVCFHTGVQDKFRRIVLGSLARAAAQFTPCPGTGQSAHKKTGRRFQGKFDMAYGEVLLRKYRLQSRQDCFAEFIPRHSMPRKTIGGVQPAENRLAFGSTGNMRTGLWTRKGGSPRVKGNPGPCGNRNRGWRDALQRPARLPLKMCSFSTPAHWRWAGVSRYMASDASNSTTAKATSRANKKRFMACLPFWACVAPSAGLERKKGNRANCKYAMSMFPATGIAGTVFPER